MNALKLLFIISAAFSISACSFDKNSNSDSKVNAENYAYLTAKYNQVAGLYRGTLNISGQPDIEITLTKVEIASGVNSRGQTLLIPALVARLAYSAERPVILNKVDYRDDTVPPQVLMASAAGEVTNPENMTARFEVQGTDLVGTISRVGRTLGTARLKLISRETESPAEGDQEADNERLRRALAPVVGSYDGWVTPDENDPNRLDPRFRVTLDVSIKNKKDPRYPSQELQIPTLVGTFKRRIIGGGDRGTNVTIAYLPHANPPKLDMTTDGSIDGGNPEQITISGSFINGVIEGTFQGANNRTYPMKLIRK